MGVAPRSNVNESIHQCLGRINIIYKFAVNAEHGLQSNLANFSQISELKRGASAFLGAADVPAFMGGIDGLDHGAHDGVLSDEAADEVQEVASEMGWDVGAAAAAMKSSRRGNALPREPRDITLLGALSVGENAMARAAGDV